MSKDKQIARLTNKIGKTKNTLDTPKITLNQKASTLISDHI